MDFNIEVRKKQLENLEQFISSSTDRVQSVLDYLGWTAEKVQAEETPMVVCPINTNHTMPPNTLSGHIKKCIIKSEGYALNDEFLSEPMHCPQQSIALDYNKKIEILCKASAENPYFRPAWNGQDPDPRTLNRLMTTYSNDERLEFYNYSVENTVGPEPPPEFSTLHDAKHEEDRPLTIAEELAKERDAKRRRAKYKSVHINRKNYTEVIREVINGQMEEYKEWLSSKDEIQSQYNNDQNNKDCTSNNEVNIHSNNKEKIEEHERPHSSSRNSNHSNSSKNANKRCSSDSFRDKRGDYYSKSSRSNDSKYRHNRSPIKDSYKERSYRRRHSSGRRGDSREKRNNYERPKKRH